ncbi:MAG: response regulator [Elusimicrobia bacterium]|nr:response regulator [Elusimicrobiota bacterium]
MRRILVVDDEQEVRESLRFELGNRGFDVVTAESGKECLAKVNNERFDLILLDLQMPRLGGLQTLAEIKKTKYDTDVIMMTGNATVETALESIKIGAFDYVIKPFNFDELTDKIDKCLVREIVEKQKILVVDNDSSSADFLVDLLTLEKFKVVVAKDGKTAIEKAIELQPDLVIMDIMLPSMNGWEVAKVLKDNNKTAHIPVVIFTAQKTGIKNEIASLKLGVEDYITRPCDTDVLLGKIRNTLHKTEKIKDLKETVALYEITQAVGSLMELEELLNLVLKLAVEISDSDGGSLLLYYPESKEYEIKTIYGEFSENIIGRRIKVGERIIGSGVIEKTPMVIHGHLKEDPRFKHLEEYKEVKSAMILPMVVRGTLIGYINLKRTKNEKKFTIRETNLLSVFASQSGLSIENTSLHQQIKKHVEELEQKVQERTRQLLMTEKLRTMGQVATNIAHEFKNYLAIIKMSVEYCLLKLPLDEKVRAQLKTILENEELAYQSIKNLSTFSKPAEIAFQPQQVSDILDDACRFLEIRFRQQKVKLNNKYNGNNMPLVLVDKTYIQSVFINLLINSLQAISIGGEIKIETSGMQDKKMVDVTITDTGCGIPDDKLKNIFEPFFTTKMDGSGLGLAIAKQIVEHHSGKINVKSEQGKGTAVIVSLPIA